jgi:hypothetical protein
MGKYLDMIRSAEKTQDKEPIQEQSSVEQAGLAITPGARITWKGGDGAARGPATVDFLHTDPMGTRWAFVTQGSGEAAVNIKFVTSIE